VHNVLVYGDSITWGIVPESRNRFPFDERWPGVLENHLRDSGKNVRVIEDSLNGRRTVWEDPFRPGRNGRQGLAQRIEIHSPLSLVIVMLGTNDFQFSHPYNNAWSAAQGIVTLVNAGSYGHAMPGPADINSPDDISRRAINLGAEHNPGLIGGVKLRLVGPVFQAAGEAIIGTAKAVAKDLGVPLMVHIGDATATDGASAARRAELTRFLLRTFEPGDILTHLCTPRPGGVLDRSGNPYQEVTAARSNGVTLDSAIGLGNFGIEVARRQADIGLYPDTISSDLTVGSQTFHSLLECMAKFMAIGYPLPDVIKATTANAARALGLADEIGAIAVGRDADLSVIDVVDGDFTFTDTNGLAFRGRYGLVPVRTIKAGEEFSPGWGTHPWGWLPASSPVE